MDWDNIRVFLCVARLGQFLAAARHLRVDHGTISRKISALESTLGIRLFDRHTTGCVLTAAGERLLESAEIVEAELLRAHGELSQLDAEISGSVRIGVPDGFGTLFLSERLGKLKMMYPALTIQLITISRAPSLSKREVDLAIVIERPKEGRLAVRKLTDYSLHFYASEAYLRERGIPKTSNDLETHHNVTYVHDLLAVEELNFVAEIYGRSYSRVECSTAVAQIAAVRGGAGIGILHDYAAFRDPGLQIVLPAINFERTYWMITHTDVRHLKRVRAVSDFIVAEAKEQKWLFQSQDGTSLIAHER
jgi:DNA-binding transcriptional LysR family regulator